VFNAKENLLEDAPAEKKSSAATKAPAKTKNAIAKKTVAAQPSPQPSANSIDADDDILISDNMPGTDDATPHSDAFSDELNANIIMANPAKTVDTNLFERTDTTLDNDDDEENHDESWALNLLDDDSEVNNAIEEDEQEFEEDTEDTFDDKEDYFRRCSLCHRSNLYLHVNLLAKCRLPFHHCCLGKCEYSILALQL
jgi:hypothetical protein